MALHVVDHPIAHDLLLSLRDKATPLVRTQDDSYFAIGSALDSGALGIIKAAGTGNELTLNALRPGDVLLDYSGGTGILAELAVNDNAAFVACRSSSCLRRVTSAVGAPKAIPLPTAAWARSRSRRRIPVSDDGAPSRAELQPAVGISRGSGCAMAIVRRLSGPASQAAGLAESPVSAAFITTGATKWADPKNFPWTMGGMASYHSEGIIYAKHVLRTKPDAKIAILSQNDDFGRDAVGWFHF